MYSPCSAQGSFHGPAQHEYTSESQYNSPLHTPMDDLTYRYSAEFERGVPTTGIYAQDGLWDDDELSSDATTVRPGSGSTFGQSSRNRASMKAERSSSKGRSRSGTVSSSNAKEDKAMWTWNRRPSTATRTSQVEKLPDSNIEAYPIPSSDLGRTLEKKKSKSLLRGKGRRGELTVDMPPANLADESFEAPPPLPATPASFLTASSPAVSTMGAISPRSYPSRLPARQEPAAPAVAGVENKPPKSSWKRGMQKLFKSKSSVALREAFSSLDPNRPPLPDHLPKPRPAFGKPFSSSTPPMSTIPAARDTTWSLYSHSPLSPPVTAAARSMGHASHPSLPADPFASSLDSPANHSPNLISPPKPRLSRNSPSLRDLKQFLAPSKPRLTKAKSLANIKPSDTTAPPVCALPSSTSASPAVIPKRVKSLALLSTRYRQAVAEEPADTLPELARPKLSRLPTESPPLLPPNPPYFPSALSPRPASTTSTPAALTIDTSPSVLSPPPASPLPAPPASAPLSPVGTSPIQRSGSGPVLLPRSRSTSMSLKAPPTSSSFFDLYEQLGIWPTPAEKETMAEKGAASKGAEAASPKAEPLTTVSQSTSTTFSATSWEAAISAFPLVEEDSPVVVAQGLDFGMPEMADHDFGDVASEAISPMIDDGYRLMDASMTSIAAVGGSTCSMSTAAHGSSNRTSTTQPTTTSSSGTVTHGGRSLGHGGRGLTSSRGDGSNEGSRPGSRDERRKQDSGSWFDGGSDHSSDSSDEEDDKPLSEIHPQAAAAQQEEVRRKASRRAARARAKGRNPGGDVMWDGEGGVPADVLRRRLEAVMATRKERLLNWQLAQGQAAATRQMLPAQLAALSIQPTRSLTDPPRAETKAAPVGRSQTVRRDARQHMPMALSPTSINSATMPHPPAVPGADRHSSSRASSQMTAAGPTAGPSRPPSSPAASSIHHFQHGSALPLGPNVSRSTTAAVSRSSTTSKSRARALSSAASTHKPDARPGSVTEPLPKRSQQAVKANAFVGDLNGHRLVLDLYPETTAKDALSASHHRGDLPELASGLNWIVVEVFAERGYERPVREYETLQAIVKGWDAANQLNCFVFRQSINAPSTWTRGIPTHAPFLGAYVQYETKKGKWSKRFLETRGGQVFVSKNDKNKEEVQINTLFHDVYTTTRQHNSPKPFVFVMKRVEPASLFENSNDYTHVFCAEENIAWKLIVAVYDAKSHAIAQAQPQLLMAAPTQRRPSTKPEGHTLLDLTAKPKESPGAFTGKGLLKI